MLMVMAMVMIKCPNLEKKKEKQNGLKANVYLIGSFHFATQDAKWV
jgi:hypothetical protein